MIVTIGGISVRVTLPEDVSRGPIHAGRRELGSRLTRFLSRGDRYDLDLTIKPVREAPWNEILTDEDDVHMRRIARGIERRFPFTAIHFNSDAEGSPSGGERTTARHLAAFDTGHVSVIPHPAFLVTVDHRMGRVDALVKVEEDEDGKSSLVPVLQGALAVCAPDYGALMLHAASLAVDGNGYLFVGNSGAGKSTVAASVDPGSVLSDDGSWCSRTDGRFSLFATPFSQVDASPRPESRAPLKHIFFLEKGTGNRAADLSPGRAMAMLLSNHVHFFRFMGRETAVRAFELAAELCRKHRAFILTSTRNFKPSDFIRGMESEEQKAV
jgi:hypothetical protein